MQLQITKGQLAACAELGIAPLLGPVLPIYCSCDQWVGYRT